MKIRVFCLAMWVVVGSACDKAKESPDHRSSKTSEKNRETTHRGGKDSKEASRSGKKSPTSPKKETPTQKNTAGGGKQKKNVKKSFDILNASVIPVQKDLTEAYKKGKKAVYRVRMENAEAKIPSFSYQEVRSVGPKEFLVTLLRPSYGALPKTRLPLKESSQLRAFLRPSPTLQSNAPLIKKLARKAISGTKEALLAAKRLETFVYGHIDKKGYAVPAATALDVAKARQGDCSEHAYLLAALARAVRIPSRVVSGLLFAPRFLGKKSVFVYHMWAELWLGSGWVPFDATRPKPGVGVTHLALATDDMNSMVPLGGTAIIMRTMGQMSIKVVKVVLGK